jgi:MoxR-like ATPase
VTDRIPEPATPAGVRAVEFASQTGLDDCVHLLQARDIHAVNAAIAAGRPLLVRGEPGVGKSQLARAAANELGRVFIKHVIDSHTESRDLMWTFDAVKRLAEAQLAGALRDDIARARAELAVERFLHPGPLWWAFNWPDAEEQRGLAGGETPPQPDGGDWRNGCVLLLDEIDKAETEVPNGLLEALGAREFTPAGRGSPVRAIGVPPLVVITTNEERVLPDAFLRRCLVLHLGLPETEADLIAFLIARGRAHFPRASDDVLREAANLLHEDRMAAIQNQIRPYPGQAEYLDLLRAVLGLAQETRTQLEMLAVVREYTLRKQIDTLAAG